MTAQKASGKSDEEGCRKGQKKEEERERDRERGGQRYIMNELSGPCAFYGHVNY